MGIDAGFGMVPPLSRTEADLKAWNIFIDIVKQEFSTDERLEVEPNYLSFNAGGVPTLLFEGFKFLRFSSKVSGGDAAKTGAWELIETVSRIAKFVFGSRFVTWNEAFDQFGHYNWNEVDDSLRSYEQVDGWSDSEAIGNFLTDPTSAKDTQKPLFEVQPVPGKGKGLIAVRKITMGMRIPIEEPFLQANNVIPALLEPIIARDLKCLSKEKQRQFLPLHNNFPGKHPFSGIMKTNALLCGSVATVGAIYPTICFINHACCANAHNSWNERLEQETIHAIRDIEPGEEITIPYDHEGPSTARRPWLKDKLGFSCSCQLCLLRPADLEKSDERREGIQQLDNDIGDTVRMMRVPSASLLNCRALLQTLKEEFEKGTNILVARANYDAFQIAIVHGDVARAAIFVERAYQVRLLCEAGDSPDTKRMQQLAESPELHPSARAHSMRWKTKKSQVPRELSEDQFENWLWRRR